MWQEDRAKVKANNAIDELAKRGARMQEHVVDNVAKEKAVKEAKLARVLPEIFAKTVALWEPVKFDQGLERGVEGMPRRARIYREIRHGHGMVWYKGGGRCATCRLTAKIARHAIRALYGTYQKVCGGNCAGQ